MVFWLAELTVGPPNSLWERCHSATSSLHRVRSLRKNRWVELARARHPARILMSERVSQFRTVGETASVKVTELSGFPRLAPMPRGARVQAVRLLTAISQGCQKVGNADTPDPVVPFVLWVEAGSEVSGSWQPLRARTLRINNHRNISTSFLPVGFADRPRGSEFRMSKFEMNDWPRRLSHPRTPYFGRAADIPRSTCLPRSGS